MFIEYFYLFLVNLILLSQDTSRDIVAVKNISNMTYFSSETLNLNQPINQSINRDVWVKAKMLLISAKFIGDMSP